jgi:sulfofructose kinase
VSSTDDNQAAAPVVLCAGIAVQDLIFRVERFPAPGSKTQASEFVMIGGGCAANAAVAIARLGGRARYAGPLGGPAGVEMLSDHLVAELAREGVATGDIVRVDGAIVPVSVILVDAAGERMIVTRRDPLLNSARVVDPEALATDIAVLLVDNRYPDFVLPICQAARRRGRPVVVDADLATSIEHPLFAVATHVIFSAECLLGTTGMNELEPALHKAAGQTDAFIAVTNGPHDMLWMQAMGIHQIQPFAIEAIDTVAAGDVFHGAFALALAEHQDERSAMQFAAATAALKCTRFGGIAGAPRRAEVDAFLARHA